MASTHYIFFDFKPSTLSPLAFQKTFKYFDQELMRIREWVNA